MSVCEYFFVDSLIKTFSAHTLCRLYNIPIFLVSSIALFSPNFAFNLGFLGVDLNLRPQQGQNNPSSHFINRPQTLPCWFF